MALKDGSLGTNNDPVIEGYRTKCHERFSLALAFRDDVSNHTEEATSDAAVIADAEP